jgi:CxxxxCH...CXXCH motif protein
MRRLYLHSILVFAGIAAIMVVSGCGSNAAKNQESQGTQINASVASGSNLLSTLPKHGKVLAAVAPTFAVFGEIYINTTDNSEWIYDGKQWVPHNSSVDQYYAQQSAIHSLLTPTEVLPTGGLSTPTGAHGGGTDTAKHSVFACTVCHYVGGVLQFDPAGPAVNSSYPAPVFDATAKSCSNVACHTVAPGTFSYYFSVDGNGDPVLYTVNYGGGAPRPTPSWYATGAVACTACHDDPPLNGSTGSNAWHSGYHANQGPTGPDNQCQFCHPDASSPNNGIGDTITNPTLHDNGVVNVQAKFTNICFNCH